MIQLSLAQAAQYIHAQLHGIDADAAAGLVFRGMDIDSRRIGQDALFIALGGEHVDGHNFVTAAQAAGAIAAVVERPLDCDLPQLVVEDGRTALAQLAMAWRHQLHPRVVGVTGSNGKTTVKNLLAGILATQGATLATPGNYNNELGLPLTLGLLCPEHRFAVLEMGARHPGDIDVLAALAAPQVGVLNNAGPAHLETFGSLDGVARAKGEMFSSLPSDGIAVLNADDTYADYWRQVCAERRVISFGRDASADVRCADAGPECRIHTPAGDFTTQLQLHGSHNVMNALAATAAALALEVPLDAIARGLAAVAPEHGRLEYHSSSAGWMVIDDTYNANPASLYAAISTAAAESEQPLWLVLGDMGELGEGARKLHAEMGEAARQLGVQRLFAVGELSTDAVRAFGPGGEHFAQRDGLIQRLSTELAPGVRCLIKGSRSAGMEHVVQALLQSCSEDLPQVVQGGRN